MNYVLLMFGNGLPGHIVPQKIAGIIICINFFIYFTEGNLQFVESIIIILYVIIYIKITLRLQIGEVLHFYYMLV